MADALHAILRDRRGATAVEYGMIVALVALAAATAIMTLGDSVAALWNGIVTKVMALL